MPAGPLRAQAGDRLGAPVPYVSAAVRGRSPGQLGYAAAALLEPARVVRAARAGLCRAASRLAGGGPAVTGQPLTVPAGTAPHPEGAGSWKPGAPTRQSRQCAFRGGAPPRSRTCWQRGSACGGTAPAAPPICGCVRPAGCTRPAGCSNRGSPGSATTRPAGGRSVLPGAGEQHLLRAAEGETAASVESDALVTCVVSPASPSTTSRCEGRRPGRGSRCGRCWSATATSAACRPPRCGCCTGSFRAEGVPAGGVGTGLHTEGLPIAPRAAQALAWHGVARRSGWRPTA